MTCFNNPQHKTDPPSATTRIASIIAVVACFTPYRMGIVVPFVDQLAPPSFIAFNSACMAF